MVEAITIVLNGVEVSGFAGMTIFDLARESGVYIPTLCYDPNLVSTGACRLCLVEDERTGAMLASCVTPIAPGMLINTNSSKVMEHRRKILELMLASHPDTCLVCDKGNSCQLRRLAAEMGIGLVEFDKIPQPDVIEEVNPFIERDLSKCILCGKCIRADQELVVEGAIDYIDRGTRARPATVNDTPLEMSECSFCGACLAVCPTGAIMEKGRRYTGTTTTQVTTICPFCGCGCTLELGVKDGKVVRSRPSAAGPVNRGTACVRGVCGVDFIHSPERLTVPMMRVDEEFREVSWEEALSTIATAFKKIRADYGADALAVLGSPRCTNEENYLLQRFSRSVLGTNNTDNSSRLYSAASRIGLGASIGYAGTTGSIGALERSGVIIVIGANPEISAPAVAYAIKRAVRFKGAGLIVIDPRETPLTRFARLWLRPVEGTDIALLNGLARVIVSEGRHDEEFVTRKTDNFSGWAESLERYRPAYVEGVTGVPRKDIQMAARLLGGAEEASIIYGNGITQRASGASAVVAIANLAMLTGNTGRCGGVFALQRENNAHGAGDMGTLPAYLPGYQSINDAENRQRFVDRWGSPLPETEGLTALEMMESARSGKLKGMLVMGENPVTGFPQPGKVREALSSLEFLVVADMFLTETARLAKFVLPVSSFAEKEGTFTNFEGRVQRLRKAIEPVGESLPDAEIILKLAAEMDSPLPYASQREVAEEIEEMVPLYHNLARGDVDTWGQDWGNGADNKPGTRRLYKGLFPSGFGRFSAVEFKSPPENQTDEYPLTLMAGSSRFGFGGGSRSSRSSRLSRYVSRTFLEISPADAADLGIDQGENVRVISPHGQLETGITINNSLRPGEIFIPIFYPETPVHELFSSDYDNLARAPALKSCAVRLERVPSDA